MRAPLMQLLEAGILPPYLRLAIFGPCTNRSVKQKANKGLLTARQDSLHCFYDDLGLRINLNIDLIPHYTLF